MEPGLIPEHIPNEDDLRDYVLGRLPESRLLVVHQHLCECGLCLGRLAEMAVSDNPFRNDALGGSAERRRDIRIPADVRATMRPLHPTILERAEVLVLNESAGGFKFRTFESLDPGVVVQIRLKTRFILAEVRYCKPAADGFHVGVKFLDDHVPIL